ncbi:MAG: hypothetical protein K2X50_02555 [Gammaproteobacteria bacterium]|nr:hypothetical protein [Gammaproteobacteria bacterium]
MKKTLGRYIVATPETIKSLIEQGVFPTELEAYVSPRAIRLFNIHTDPSIESHTVKEQTFLVEVVLELDVNDPLTEIHEQSQYSCVSKIEPKHVKCIYTFSEKGKRLLVNKLGKSCNIPLIIDASKFAMHTARTVTEAAGCTNGAVKRETPDQKEADESMAVGSYAGILKRLKPEPGIVKEEEAISTQPDIRYADNLSRLSSTEEHKAFLKYAFDKAKKTILLTSYALSSECFELLDVYSLIIQARKRGVAIYIYYSDQKAIEEEVFEFLKHYGVKVDQMFTHSKILIVDEIITTIGSFNWLSGVTKAYPNACDGTVVLQSHQACGELKDDLWNHIKRYRHFQFENTTMINRFNEDDYNFSAIEYPVNSSSNLIYFPTLDQQRGYLIDSLEAAQESIVICSPFISTRGEFINDFDQKTLTTLSGRGVQVIFVCDANNKNIEDFINFINTLESPYIHVVLTTNFHLKTIIVDEKEISEGSFNWLSAVRDEESGYHNHEAVVVVTGEKALPLIGHFHSSPVGQAIATYFDQLSSEDEQLDDEAEEHEEESSSIYYSY